MEIAVVMNAHKPSDVIVDTLDSICRYVSRNVLVVVDGKGWHKFESESLPVAKVKGFPHGLPKAPYKNVAFGLMMAADQWPEADWYCYCEYDVLFGSDRFKQNLKMADDMGVWMLGSDGRIDSRTMPLVESIVGNPFKDCYYMIGCCQFFSASYMKKLKEIRFFDRFLTMTNNFSASQFPKYDGYDISEHMYPTMARHFGGNLGVFATWDGHRWHGSEYYTVRWRPDLEEDVDKYANCCIMHPIKEYDHPVRKYHRERRSECLMTNA